MDSIEKIWDRGNDSIAKDDSISSDSILKSISESSVGITASLLKTIWFGVVMACIAIIMFILNLFFYMANPPMLIPIIACLIVSVLVLIFFLLQIGALKRMDSADLDLHKVLVFKISYLSTKFSTALHLISLSIVLVTFAINLTMEGNDATFGVNRVHILLVFYLISYLFTFSIFSLTHKVYDKQLKTALLNLEDSSLRSLDKELKQHKRRQRIILIIVALLFLSGIVVFLLLD